MSLKSSPLLVIALVLGCLAFATGCGDDDGAATGADRSAETTGDVTNANANASFVEEANSVCVEHRKQLQEELEPFLEVRNPSAESELEIIDEVVIPGFEAEVEDLRALEPPADFEQELETVIEAIEEMIAEAEDTPETFAAEERPYAKTGKVADEEGLPACGHP